ncbi:hypothetical protein CBR_g30228 [Chara braunii]|uniref:DNA helicase n=1 Tax=Chara braunii TaxID=69332 RepID=A0A388LCF1_CHABU|nr:hypothetical protein CBR_g30228 [Chara braunii]|eukprot:GBG79966.1 hypothetical protein CBR_g30228 [Chara braunii]
MNVHNFPSFSKNALDLDAKIGHGHQPTTDGRKKTPPPNWKAKDRIMFVDNDGSTIELDDDFQEGVGTEAGSVEASGGGAVVASVQEGKATGRRRGVSRFRSQVDPNAPPWEKAGLTEDVRRDWPGDSLSMDFMDKLVTSKSGMRYIYVIVDRFSKYARLVAMPATAKTEYVIKLFKENWVRDFGLPKSIVSDRDVRFTSDLWKAAAAEQGAQLQMTSGNRPEANGQAEQLNGAVQHLLRHYIKPNQVDWDEKLALIASLYNNSVHRATGVSPNSLLLTFKPRLPLDFLLPDNQPTAALGTLEFAYRYEQLMQQAVEQMRKAQAAMIESENKHCRASTFQVGDRVWVKSSDLGQEHGISRKLMPEYFGPWEVLDVVGGDPDGPSYVIRIGHLRTYPVFHASKLAPFEETDQFPSRRSMLPPTMDGEVDIDDIVDHREMPVPRPTGRGRPPKPKLQYCHGQGVPIAVRHIESMIRMSEAHARMHLRSYVNDDDVDTAIRVMLESFISTQKYGVQKALSKSFKKFMTYKKDFNELLLHILRQLVKEAMRYDELMSRSRRVTSVEIKVDDLEAKAREYNIMDLHPFFASQQFTANNFTVDPAERIIRHHLF